MKKKLTEKGVWRDGLRMGCNDYAGHFRIISDDDVHTLYITRSEAGGQYSLHPVLEELAHWKISAAEAEEMLAMVARK